jgi:5-methylcytosine-specific restriction endonuclease McrA
MDCQPAREQATHPNKHIYSSKRWRILRRHILWHNPLCIIEGCDEIATDVDHIIGIEDGGDPWAPANLQSMCRPHHAQKTSRELNGRGKTIRIHGR